MANVSQAAHALFTSPWRGEIDRALARRGKGQSRSERFSIHPTSLAIGESSRREIEKITEGKVHLFLFVKVREGWGDDPERYRAMGLEFPNE